MQTQNITTRRLIDEVLWLSGLPSDVKFMLGKKYRVTRINVPTLKTDDDFETIDLTVVIDDYVIELTTDEDAKEDVLTVHIELFVSAPIKGSPNLIRTFEIPKENLAVDLISRPRKPAEWYFQSIGVGFDCVLNRVDID